MAAKKATKNQHVYVNKSEFIRSHADKQPADIVKLAAAKGIKLTPTFVYSVRNAANRKAKGSAKAKRPAKTPTSSSASPSTTAPNPDARFFVFYSRGQYDARGMPKVWAVYRVMPSWDFPAKGFQTMFAIGTTDGATPGGIWAVRGDRSAAWQKAHAELAKFHPGLSFMAR